MSGSDERGGIVRLVLRFITFLCFAALVIFIVKNYENISIRRVIGFFTASEDRKTADYLDIAADPQNFYYSYRGGIAVMSRGGLSVIAPDNEEALYIQKNFQKPLITGNDRSFLACDIGQPTLVYVSEYESNTFDMPGAVLSAEMNANGYMAVITEESGSKAAAAVLLPDLSEKYKWFSSERYLLRASVSPKNDRMAVGCISERGARIVSSVCIFKLDELDMQASYEFFDSFIFELRYISDDRVAVLTESALLIIDNRGSLISEYSFDGRAVYAFSPHGENFLALVLGDAAGMSTRLLTLDYDGNMLGNIEISDLTSLSVKSRKLAVLTSGGLLVYNTNLDDFTKYSAPPGVKHVLLREDGSALLIGSTKATLLTP